MIPKEKLHLFRPERLILPLEPESAVDSPALASFIARRIAAGDPGPLYINDGVATTDAWDAELQEVREP